MVVRRIGLCISLCFLISACAEDPFAGIFPGSTPENKTQTTDACTGASVVPNKFIVTWTDGHVSVESSENAAVFKEKFLRARLSQIQHVEFDQVVKLRDVGTPDPTAPVVNENLWGQTIVQAAAAWNAGVHGESTLVGVVDAAVDYSHPQLQTQLAPNAAEINGRAGIDDDGNGFIDDFYGWDFEQNQNNPANIVSATNDHGTHVSGIIAADHTHGPMQGIAPQAKIVPANFMGSDGSGSLGAAIQAIQYVSSRGVKVINASWGGPSCSQTLKETIQGLAAKNILFVVASGNDGVDLDVAPDYPAVFNFPNQLTVAASNSNDLITSFSNTSFSLVHLAAPGDTIYSTVPGANYAFMSGTSMATPFVTGTAALLWGLRPNATYAQIRQAILAGVDVRPGYRVQSGGRLNIANAVEALKKILPATP